MRRCTSRVIGRRGVISEVSWSGSRRGCLLIVSRCPADTFTFAQRGEGFILLLILVQLIGTPALHRIFIFSA